MAFEPFRYASLKELQDDCAKRGLPLSFSEDVSVLKRPVALPGGFTIPNSMAVHPMEGSDGDPDGSPGELTIRRCMRFAEGGAGLIWFEAVAVVPEARAVPRQLHLHKGNADAYKRLLERMRKAHEARYGVTPVIVAQLTHSGRFSKPEGKPAPILACHDPYLDGKFNVPADLPVLTDSQLEALEDRFAESALLAKQAGFDGADVKACHRYLLSELLSAHTREGRYGGGFEGRTRFLVNAVGKARSAAGSGFLIASRLNIYDGIPYPYGWGVDRDDVTKPDLTEPIRLVGMLKDRGVGLLNCTMGSPYYNPHVNRPYDKGAYLPDEHPLTGVHRLASCIGGIQKAYPDLPVVGTGYSWLRQYAAAFAAANVEQGNAAIVGFGRGAFAYPDFARDILEKGKLERRKCCVACGKCAELLRAGRPAGCVVRDIETYVPIYRELTGK